MDQTPLEMIMERDKEDIAKAYIDLLASNICLEQREKRLHLRMANMRRDFKAAIKHLKDVE